MMRATATAISSKDTRSACVASQVSAGRIFCLSLSAKESCSMRKLILVFLCVILVAACNRDRAENTDTGATSTDSAVPASNETTATMTGTSATAPIQATGTTEVSPTDTSSTIVTPTTTTASVTTPTETSSTVMSTTTR